MVEIERKFLVDINKWHPATEGHKIIQGYLSTDKNRVVRVRVKGDNAYLTIKGESKGISRTELEYEIPFNDAKILLEMCVDFPVEKIRYVQEFEGKVWEIDVFENVNEGLVMAEVELQDEKEEIVLPHWISKEVSDDKRYFNAWLAKHPYSTW
ncbi:CYTH domain-containing protein [Maribellus sediminis]|uniref:CYTH domain-containing protein n=1 Tax=Maribellus sediminis TaxID=2696285 RepID=UPI00142F8424|nr:CYTH domain-containing protein [Maribellus sediminis]